MTLNGVMTVTLRNLRYFAEFGKHAFQHITASICDGIYARVFCILYSARVRFRHKESSRSLSHLLISFLFYFSIAVYITVCINVCLTAIWRNNNN